ncbi:MAG: hypothetical protein MUE72_04115 [Chitinophagaceae bacterium]|nr:hypothetical protein [Chitinophagaceae bacterium]
MIFVFCLSFCAIFCQVKIVEPEFAGEAFLVKNDTSYIKLSKSISQLKYNPVTVLFSPSKVYLQIDSCCSSTRVSFDTLITIIVKSIDNKTDPMSIIGVFKFEQKRKLRRAEVASMGIFSSTANNKNYVKYEAKKYGESSYLLTIQISEKGEFGVIVRNPNSPVNAAAIGVIISSFGLD